MKNLVTKENKIPTYAKIRLLNRMIAVCTLVLGVSAIAMISLVLSPTDVPIIPPTVSEQITATQGTDSIVHVSDSDQPTG